jgi:hypothetical protein
MVSAEGAATRQPGATPRGLRTKISSPERAIQGYLVPALQAANLQVKSEFQNFIPLETAKNRWKAPPCETEISSL